MGRTKRSRNWLRPRDWNRRARTETRGGGRRRRGNVAFQGRLGHYRDLRDVQPSGAGNRAQLRGLRAGLPTHGEWSATAHHDESRCAATWRAAIVQHGRDGSAGATDNGTGTLTMMEAMRILKTVYPRPKRTIIAGHWTGEEQGEVGSKAFTEDHPEVIKGLQVLFNQDNGTGRILRLGGAGLPNAAEHISRWLGQLPASFKEQLDFRGPGFPAGGGSDDFAFACYGTPAIGLSSLNWNYFNYTWHTNRDTYDKIVFDDLRWNATLTAMLAYLASEDPTMITRERVDLAAAAAAAAATPTAPGRGGRGIPTTWPECVKA